MKASESGRRERSVPLASARFFKFLVVDHDHDHDLAANMINVADQDHELPLRDVRRQFDNVRLIIRHRRAAWHPQFSRIYALCFNSSNRRNRNVKPCLTNVTNVASTNSGMSVWVVSGFSQPHLAAKGFICRFSSFGVTRERDHLGAWDAPVSFAVFNWLGKASDLSRA